MTALNPPTPAVGVLLKLTTPAVEVLLKLTTPAVGVINIEGMNLLVKITPRTGLGAKQL
jgi:hypothetical protein